MATNNQMLGIVTEVPMGDWNATTPYQKLNTVRHNGAAYKARKQNIGMEPSVTQGWQEVWMLIVKDGKEGPQGKQGLTGASGLATGAVLSNEPGTSDINGYTQAAVNGIISNPNLFINGDFRVNQRGQTSYVGTGYTVDRWRNVAFSSGIVTPTKDGLRLQFDTASTGFMLQYAFEEKDFQRLQGKTVTMSFALKSEMTNNVYLRLLANGTNVGNTANGVATIALPDTITSLVLQIRKSGSPVDVVFKYAKLEHGSIATPNSLRPYAEELAMCQRYGRLYSKDFVIPQNPLDCSPPMRVSGTITTITIDGVQYQFRDAEIY